MELPSRVTDKVVKTDSCWLWTGHIQPNGFGYATWRRSGGKWGKAAAHRLYYEAFVGPIPPGLEVTHICRVRHCVRPDHLRAVTHGELLRSREHIPAPIEECKRGHKYTEENTYWSDQTKGGGRSRSCRTCARERYQARKGAAGFTPGQK